MSFPGGTDWQASISQAALARAQLHQHIGGWLGERECDRADFAGAVCATRDGDGEPLWGMMLDAASGGKTEVVRMTAGVRDEMLDEFTSASLLSFSKAKNPKAVGKLLRIPAKALITIADFSTVLAMSDRGMRDQLFSDLRRVYDGELSRDLGNMEAGLRWRGRLTLLAASTPALDEYSSHADKLGPRWLYHRSPDTAMADRRAGAGRRISERELTANRAQARKLFTPMVLAARAAYPHIVLTDAAEAALGDAAVVAAVCRTPVPRDGYGRREITGLPATEEPYRLAAQLKSLARALIAMGVAEQDAVASARVRAMDTVPPIRVRVLRVLCQGGARAGVAAIGRACGADRKVVRRAAEDLRALGITACPAEDASDEEDTAQARVFGASGQERAKLWMMAESRNEDLAERVTIVRDVVTRLGNARGGVPNRDDALSDSQSTYTRSGLTYTSEHPLDGYRNPDGGYDWAEMFRRADHRMPRGWGTVEGLE
jgi:hypothetical protein